MATRAQRKAAAQARRAIRAQNAKRGAGYWGKQGYSKYQGGTRATPDNQKNTIVVVNPANPQQGRIVRLGRRGGVRGVGGSHSTRWGDASTMMGIVKALPGAALLTSAAAVGAVMLKDSPTINALKKKTPGGGNGLAFVGGAATAYVAYRYRSLILFLSGLGLAAYALIKFGNKEAKLLDEYGSDEALEEGGSTSPQLEQSPQEVLPSKVEEASDAFEAGDKAFNSGNFDGAIKQYEKALSATNDPIIYYSIAQSYRKIAQSFDDKANPNAKKAAKSAVFYYNLFISNAKPTTVVDAATLNTYKGRAAQFSDSLKSLFLSKGSADDEMPVRGQYTPKGAQILISGQDEDDDDEGDFADGDQEISGDEDDDDEDDDYVGDGYDDDEDDGYEYQDNA